ncbi:PEP-CTERM sorting domain-containing protein [Adhaeretor mobilis]|uniref:PEP-CTERM protein-sorting domain-containing protein n=1 Tax=Adhaeretor mobilis TaxID=1930276 RepID=A0A517N115_9BACT|nr:PEP-CTERM sorting domain-containing protein [Adhaeretor mobilis]QDT00814.1 hypothetical protein HG15A2_41560 [Adhaeretor mobilis]
MSRINSWQASCLVALLMTATVSVAQGVDLEAFEFSDSGGTQLSAAANSVNASNMWSADISGSSVQSGAFFVGKDLDDLASSYLQIDNINAATGSSRYIVATMSGWEFFDSVVGQGEEVRFAFIDEDTGNSGNTVIGEVRIDRNTDNETIELRGVASGNGSVDIGNRATLATAQSNPFTMALEYNPVSRTYEVFYKDGSNPSQSLGIGSVAPGRDANSVRLVVNNNFFSDFSEFLNIDRVALTDTNPFSDLLTLEVNRDTGVTKLINTTGATLSGITSGTLSSDVGAVNSGSINAPPSSLAIGAEVTLSTGSGPWIKNNTEDLLYELVASGVTRSANVNFVGNGGQRFDVGDLDFMNGITAADWNIFIAGAETDLSALTVAEAYQAGDLDGDGVNSVVDFDIFKAAFDEANGVGAFQAMLASVPEPSSFLLVAFGASILLTTNRRRTA